MNRRQLLIGGGSLVALGAGATLVSAARMGSASDYIDATEAIRAPLADHPDARDLIRFATLAPNGHNTQPWHFGVAPDRITITPDIARRTPVVDPDDHHLFISLGSAAENLALSAAARGYRGQPVFDGTTGGAITFAHEPAPPEPSPLFDAIPQRQATRSDYDGRLVSPRDLNLLARAATVPGVDLVLLTDRPRISRLRELVTVGNSAQMADAAFVHELKAWLRFNPRAALRSGDGLYSVASGNPPLPDWLGSRAFDWLSTPAAQNKSYAAQVDSSAGIAVFVGAAANSAHWVAVGHASQRFALQATALGLKNSYINQPVEVAALRPDLAALVGLPGRRPDLVMRFGYGPELPRSPRRPVASVIKREQPA